MPGSGHVYILTNKRVSGLVKIGRSNDPPRRVPEINGHAGVPGKWEIAGHVEASDMFVLEREVHRLLSAQRVSEGGGTEFFECTADEAGAAIIRCARDHGIEIVRDELPATVRAKFQLERFRMVQRERENERKRQESEIVRQQEARIENENWLKYFSENAGNLALEIDRVEKKKASAAKTASQFGLFAKIALGIAALALIAAFQGEKGSGWAIVCALVAASYCSTQKEKAEKQQIDLPQDWRNIYERAERTFGPTELTRRLSDAHRAQRYGFRNWLGS